MDSAIKYHQNGIGPEYGPDHKLTNNWDPDKDYGNTYSEVYFRILSKEYMAPPYLGFEKAEKERFYREVQAVLMPLGWYMPEHDTTWECDYIFNINDKNQRLYLHPQAFSGTIKKNDIKGIAEALRQHESFSLECVDLYKTLYDISDDAYLEYMKSRRKDIEDYIFESAKTHRRTHFQPVYNICSVAYNKIKIQRVSDNGYNIPKQEFEYIQSVVADMTKAGWLVSVKQGDTEYVRSINKSEQKSLRMQRK